MLLATGALKVANPGAPFIVLLGDWLNRQERRKRLASVVMLTWFLPSVLMEMYVLYIGI